MHFFYFFLNGFDSHDEPTKGGHLMMSNLYLTIFVFFLITSSLVSSLDVVHYSIDLNAVVQLLLCN